MKRFFAAVLTLAMMLSLCACGATAGQNEQPSEGAAAAAPDPSEEAAMTVDEGLFEVEITLPASFFEEESEEEIRAKAEENGFRACIVQEDGSVTYKMTKAKHREMLEEMRADLDESISEMIHGEDAVKSFRKIEHAEDFSSFDIYVDRAEYTSLDGLYVLAFYLSGAYDQAFDGKDINRIDVVVNFIDEATNETFASSSYRDFADQMEESEPEG